MNDAISFYRNDVRPIFRGAAETTHFWMGMIGPLSYQGAYSALARLTLRRAQMRDERNRCAPRSHGRVAQAWRLEKEESGEIMGHACPETGGRFYTDQKIISDITLLATRNGI